ncbi:MAG: methylglyoxal synthase [Leptospiraceae bacterium]|jgi:methylglyoxal synthase|nr:methylglyoxal synthase [Leptospiraceae bacterium]MCZ8345283.1 methylglyoxal synthase [Leptospiraceae bacterium]
MNIPLKKMEKVKNIVLIAHDNRKKDLLEWVIFNRGTLSRHRLFATGTTGKIIQEKADLPVHRFISGPLGGDQQIGAKIVSGEIDFMVFFWDPLTAQPHDPDVKALLRIAVLYNVPMACNRSSADFVISSSLMDEPYNRVLVDYESRLPSVEQNKI